MPDSDVSRLARLEQRVDDLARMVEGFGPTSTATATLAVQLTHVDTEVKAVRAEIGGLRSLLDNRDAQATKERRDTRVALWSLVGVLGASLISGGVAIVVAVINGAG